MMSPRHPPLLPRRAPLLRIGLGAAALLVAGALPAAAFQGNPANGPSADGSPAVGGRCAPATDRVLTGTIRGADDLGVNVTIGFDMKDAAGHTIDLATGCAAQGYSTIVQLNHDVGAHGQAVGTPTRPTLGAPTSVVTDRFSISGVPANITSTWIETYSRGSSASPCGWSCAGPIDVSKYGQVNRREVPISGAGVDLRLPLTPAFGGKTGGLAVDVVDRSGHPYSGVSKSYTWSMTSDGSRPDQGWGIGAVAGSRVTTASLGSGQDYVTWVYTDRGIYVVKHLPVRSAATTPYRLNVDGPRTLDLTTIPARSAHLSGARAPRGCAFSTRGARVTFHCASSPARPASRATMSYFGYGKWIPLHTTGVGARGSFTVTKPVSYVGTQRWRITYGNTQLGFRVTGS